MAGAGEGHRSFIVGRRCACRDFRNSVRAKPPHAQDHLGFILLALLISTIAGAQAIPSIFYVWQLLRAVLLFIAVFRLCAEVPSAPLAILSGFGSVWFRGHLRGVSIFHRHFPARRKLRSFELLGNDSTLIVFPALALTLGGRRFWPIMIVLAG